MMKRALFYVGVGLVVVFVPIGATAQNQPQIPVDEPKPTMVMAVVSSVDPGTSKIIYVSSGTTNSLAVPLTANIMKSGTNISLADIRATEKIYIYKIAGAVETIVVHVPRPAKASASPAK